MIQDDSGKGINNEGSLDLPEWKQPQIKTYIGAESDQFIVKDSGKREEFENGFVRDTEEGKADYARVLAVPGLHLIPVEMLERLGAHLVRGAAKYGENNWRKATGTAAKERFARSLTRHVRQLITGERDEDHAAAIVFNAFAYELTESSSSNDRELANPLKEAGAQLGPSGFHPEPCRCVL